MVTVVRKSRSANVHWNRKAVVLAPEQFSIKVFFMSLEASSAIVCVHVPGALPVDVRAHSFLPFSLQLHSSFFMYGSFKTTQKVLFNPADL